MLISGEEDDHANKAVLPAAMWTARDSNNIHGDSIIDNDVAAVGGYRTYSVRIVWSRGGDGDLAGNLAREK